MEKNLQISEEITPTKYLDARRIAEEYGFPLETVRKWIAQRKFKVVKPGGGRRCWISRDEFEAWLRKHEVDGFEPQK